MAMTEHAWVLAFWLFIAAITTDFFDGLVARKFNVQSRFGEEFDAATDAFTVAAGVLGLSVAHVISFWFAGAVLVIGGIIGSERHVPERLRPAPAVGKVAAVSSLFIAWVGITWVLAAKAFGWQWWYVPLTVLVLVVLAVLKRNRVRAWLAGKH